MARLGMAESDKALLRYCRRQLAEAYKAFGQYANDRQCASVGMKPAYTQSITAIGRTIDKWNRRIAQIKDGEK